MQGEDGVLLQVPKHELRVVDDGVREVVELSVQLPGVTSAGEIAVRIQPPSNIAVLVPGKYQLQLKLAVAVPDTADSVSFFKKKQMLRVQCRVLTPAEAAAATAARAAAAATSSNGIAGSATAAETSNSSSNGVGADGSREQLVTSSSTASESTFSIRNSNSGSSAAAAAAGAGSSGSGGSSTVHRPVHESFYPQPTKAEQRRRQLEEQRRQQEQEAAAAAAAAAEAERQQRAAAAAAAAAAAREAAAKKAAEQERRQQRQAEARRKAEAAAAQKAAAAAAAAEAAQRQEQQRRLNKEAAEEWLRRGHAAVAQGHIDQAAKALAKASELNPDNTTGIKQLQQQLTELRKQQAAASSRRSSSTKPSSSSGSEQQQQQQQYNYTSAAADDYDGYDSSAAGGGGGYSSSSHQGYSYADDDLAEGSFDAAAAAVQHAPGVVGWLCGLFDALTARLFKACMAMDKWASRPERHALVRWCVRALSVVLMVLPVALIWIWRKAWMQPLVVLAAIRRAGGDSFLESNAWLIRTQFWLAEEQLITLALRLMAAGCSGAAAAAGVWLLAVMQLGAHSAVGWLWAAVLWCWRAALWRPAYKLQMCCFVLMFLVAVVKEAGCSWALMFLQVMLTGGGWSSVISFVISQFYINFCSDWRPNRQDHPSQPWQAFSLGTLPLFIIRIAWQRNLQLLLLWPAGKVGQAIRWLLDLTPLPNTWSSAVSFLAPKLLSLVPGWGSILARPVVWAWAWLTWPVRYLWSTISTEGWGNSWWFDCILVFCSVIAIMYDEDIRSKEDSSSSGSRRRQQRGGSSDEAAGGSRSSSFMGDKVFEDFPMGFGVLPVPDGCEAAEVKQVLTAKSYYEVMGFDRPEDVTTETLKAKRRQLVLAVHPDKVGHDYPGANQAAGRVNKAYETLSNPTSRDTYDRVLMYHKGGRNSRSMAAAGRGFDDVDEPYDDSLYDRAGDNEPGFLQDLQCPGCGARHTIYLLPRAPFGKRWCAECEAWHPTKAGELWAHWSPGWKGLSLLGRGRILLCVDPGGPVYDVTEAIKCKGVFNFSESMCNRHTNPLNEVFTTGRGGRGGGGGGGGGGGTSTARRSRKKQGRRR